MGIFKLTENKFMDKGYCKYKDDYDSEIFVKKENNGFVLKARIKDKNIKFYPLKVKLPNNDAGYNLELDYPKDTDFNREDIKNLLEGISDICNRWTNLITDINFVSLPDSMFLAGDENGKSTGLPANKEDIILYKNKILNQHEEIKEYLLKQYIENMQKNNK